MKLPIYLDYHATTPVDPRVLEEMLPYFTEHFGNASSVNHSFGWEAENAVGCARKRVASLIGADPKEIIFTCGATESNNLALKGIAEMHRTRGNHIITAVTEHKAVIDVCKHLQKQGMQVTFLPVDKFGLIDLDMLRDAMSDKTLLVSIMHANNEIGTLQPIEKIGKLCRERGILFHTDATQTIGRIPFDVHTLNVDLASFSSHKLYGPKGCGTLYVRKKNPRVTLTAQIDGGGQEHNLRSGTLNVSGIVGFGKACEICFDELPDEAMRISRLRDQMQRRLFHELDEIYLNGHPTKRTPGNLNISFAKVPSELLLRGIKDIAVSTGAACHSEDLEPSYVLKAIGLSLELARNSIRFGLGRFTTDEEADYAISHVIDVVKKLRAESPLAELEKTTFHSQSLKASSL